jgi:hypothetical protein
MQYLKYYLTKIDPNDVTINSGWDISYQTYKKLSGYEPGHMSLSKSEFEQRKKQELAQEKKRKAECTFSLRMVGIDSRTAKKTIKKIESDPLFVRWFESKGDKNER